MIIFISKKDKSFSLHLKELGRQLAREQPCPNADLVIGVPDSSTPAAIGFALQSGIPFSEGLTKNRYIARTFIQVLPFFFSFSLLSF